MLEASLSISRRLDMSERTATRDLSCAQLPARRNVALSRYGRIVYFQICLETRRG